MALELYLKEIQFDLLDYERERELLVRKSQGDEKAFNILFNHHLQLVVSIARKFESFARENGGMDFEDLIQAGNISLITAIRRFDVDQRTNTLAAYAAWWIRDGILSEIADQSSTIRIPKHLYWDARKISKEMGDEEEYEAHEIADFLGITEGAAERALKFLNNDYAIVSLDTPVANGESFLGDLIEGNYASPEEVIELKNLDETLCKALKRVVARSRKPKRDFDIFVMRTTKDRTFQDIANEVGMTHERIRQIQDKIIEDIQDDLRLQGAL